MTALNGQAPFKGPSVRSVTHTLWNGECPRRHCDLIIAIRQLVTATTAAKAPAPPGTEPCGSGVRLLAALCRELQRTAGDEPFFLGCRTAGGLLGVNHVQAWRWMYLLQAEGLLEVTERGSQCKNKASRFRYRGAGRALI